MKQKTIYGDFYSPLKVMSYNRNYVFVVGSRSQGKSVGFGIYLLLQAIKKNKKFIYIRRTDSELKETAPLFLKDPVTIINRYYKKALIKGWKYEKNTYFVDTGDGMQEVGIAIPLSMESRYKSKNLSDFFYLFYDEFLCRDSTKYLGTKNTPFAEVEALSSLFMTVDRDVDKPYRNECVLIACANTSTLYNPIFIALGIDKYLAKDDLARFVAPKNKNWVVENSLAKDVKALSDYKNSNAYLLSSEATRQYAFESNGLDDEVFIEKATGKLQPLFNVIYNKTKMGIYIDESDYKLYVSRKYIKERVNTFALTTADHTPDYKLMQMNLPQMQLLKQFYLNGNIKFSDGGCRFAINNYLSFDKN